MATIKINVMSIIAVLAIIFGAVALGLYEADRAGQEEAREKTLENELNMYEAGICLGILISLIVLVITVCDKPDSLTGKTFDVRFGGDSSPGGRHLHHRRRSDGRRTRSRKGRTFRPPHCLLCFGWRRAPHAHHRRHRSLHLLGTNINTHTITNICT